MSSMKITYLKTSDLIPYARNAKEHPEWQIQQIAGSIKEFGFNDPIAIDKDNVIIEGHGRLLAAQLLKIEDVPTITLDHMTKNQKRAYILAHNKITMNTGFDMDILNNEFDELLSEFEFDDLNKIGLGIEGDLDFDSEDDGGSGSDKEDGKTRMCPSCGFEW